MEVIKRSKEVVSKFIFCYTATKNFNSFFQLVWFTKLYRFRKKSTRYKNQLHHLFSISLSAFAYSNIFLRIYAGDIDIFYEVFYKKIYELPDTKDRHIIIDAGANVGFAALYFLSKMPGSIIYCIEPDPDNFAVLKKNLKPEIDSGKVIPVLGALSDKDGLVNLKINPLKYNTTITKESTENEVPVIAFSVESFLKKFNIQKVDVFKMDIEGAEENIFNNHVSWLNHIEEMLIEFHSDQIKKMCFEKFESQKFSFIKNDQRKNTDVFHFKRENDAVFMGENL